MFCLCPLEPDFSRCMQNAYEKLTLFPRWLSITRIFLNICESDRSPNPEALKLRRLFSIEVSFYQEQ